MAKQKVERYSSGAVSMDPGSNYDPEEIAFMNAMDRYKRENHRPYPTWSEVLSVARALGYRLTAEPESLPRIREYHREKEQRKATRGVRFSKPR